MSDVSWIGGFYRDNWLAQVSQLHIGDIKTLDVQLFLPGRREGTSKLLLLAHGEAEIARHEITRGKLTIVSLDIDDNLKNSDLTLAFSEPEAEQGDFRSLGAVCPGLRYDNGEWLTIADLDRDVPSTGAADPEAADPEAADPEAADPEAASSEEASSEEAKKPEGDDPNSQDGDLAAIEVEYADVIASFDADYYRTVCMGPARSDLAMFAHYLNEGWLERLDPSPDFSTSFYLDNDLDLEKAGFNPLVHWVRFGKQEKRLRSPGDHLASLAPIPAPEMQPIPEAVSDHGLSADDLTVAQEFFDEQYYRSQLPDSQLDQAALLLHYMTVGWRQHLDPSREFSTAHYIRSNPELASSDVNPLLHFVRHGRHEMRSGIPFTARRLRYYKPLVSVIVPNYNHAAFLEERVQSIFSQTYSNLELILMDDCSTDNSREVLEKLAARSPFETKTVFNEQNSGNVFAQWRRAFSLAKGELVWICESDDLCESNFLELMVRHFADRGVMLAFGRIQFCDAGGRALEGLDQYRENAEPGVWAKPIVRSAQTWFANAFGRNNVIANVGGCVIRNQPISDDTWAACQRFKICADWYLYILLANGGKIAYDPGAVAYFRQHGSNTSASNFDKMYYYEEHLWVLQALHQAWHIPEATRAGFIRSLRGQWSHYGMIESHGPMEEALPGVFATEWAAPQPHILMGSLGFMIGGGESFPLYLANGLAAAGVRVSMLCINLVDLNEELLAQLDPRVSVYDASELKAERPMPFLRRVGASLVHSHVVNIDDAFFKSFEPLRDFPYVVTLHGSHQGRELDVSYLLFKMLVGVGRWVYTASRNLEIFGRAPLDLAKMPKIPNAMPADKRSFPYTRADLGIDEDTVVFAFVARGVQQKGWHAVVQAVKMITARNPALKIHAVMVGDGPKTAEARTRVSPDLPITFTGFQSCINGLYRLSDCALVPTRFDGESFPLCIIQALQEGLPVIGTDVGEIKSMLTLDDKVAGILLDNLRDSSAFSESVYAAMIAMTNARRRKAAARIAAKLGEKFDMKQLVARYIDVYEEAMESH